MHHPHVVGPETFQHVRDWLDPFAGKNPQHLTSNAGRIGNRAKQIEKRTYAELRTDWRPMLHGRMVHGRPHEANARFADRQPDALRADVQLHSEGTEHVRRARYRRH